MTWKILIRGRTSYFFRNFLLFDAAARLYPIFFNRNCSDTLTYREGMTFYHYISPESEEQLTRYFVRMCDKNNHFHNIFLKEGIKAGKNIVKFNRFLSKLDLRKLSNKKLARLLSKYVETFEAIYPYFHSTVNSAVLEKELRKYLDEEEIIMLITPKMPSVQKLEELEFLKIGMKINEVIKKHNERFFWLPTTDESMPWNELYFKNKLGLRDVDYENEYSEELDKINQLKIKRKLIEKALPKNIKAYADLLRTFIWLRMYSRNMFNFALTYSRPLFKEIGKRSNLSFEDVKFFKPSELIDFLANDVELDIKIVERRKLACLFILEDGRFTLYEGKQSKGMFKKMIPKEKIEKTNIIKGTTANKGHAEGKVRIVLTTGDAKQLKQGEILVARNTNPNFIEGMYKAAAFITDEGGITSHAAIVSREMNKPCVTATKNATKILKTGDLIEVDADRGIIRIK